MLNRGINYGCFHLFGHPGFLESLWGLSKTKTERTNIDSNYFINIIMKISSLDFVYEKPLLENQKTRIKIVGVGLVPLIFGKGKRT